MEHAVSVQSDRFTSDGIPSNSFVRFRTVTFLLKFHANKRLSEPLITLKSTIQLKNKYNIVMYEFFTYRKRILYHYSKVWH